MIEYEDTEEKPLTTKQRRSDAEKKKEELQREGLLLKPITAKSREKIAKTFWGKLWYANLSTYEDLDYRLSEGRMLVGANAILDLKLDSLQIKALILDEEVYDVTINFEAFCEDKKEALKKNLKESVSSLYSLLSGSISDELCQMITEKETGLFPELSEISFDCNCTDYASLCRHNASSLIGVSKLFDKDPKLFFKLRSLDPLSLVEEKRAKEEKQSNLSEEEVSSIFGIDIE